MTLSEHHQGRRAAYFNVVAVRAQAENRRQLCGSEGKTQHGGSRRYKAAKRLWILLRVDSSTGQDTSGERHNFVAQKPSRRVPVRHL
jgi:hypothetical protein